MSRNRIVAVDDDRRILRVLKRACESVGYEVHSVLDAEFFESSFRVFEPALVFLDLNMRHINGVQLLRFIASERRDTSVIVTSGADEPVLTAAHSLGQSLGLNMLEPIRKPLMVADVRRRLKLFRDQPSHRAPTTRPQIPAEDLDQALRLGQLAVCYQPMVNLMSRKVVCAEALARLQRPDAAVLVPEQFVPVAERCGLIDVLTLFVLERALTEASRWVCGGLPIQVAVNLSPVMLTDAALPDRIGKLLADTGVHPEQLVLEVSENPTLDDRERMSDTLRRLHLKGIRLSLDDFGTGFCSLGQLYEFPYETIKLDKKFAMRAEQNDDAAAMIRSSLDLARSVGLTVVAEGIESEETLRWLGRLGCDVGQGHYISPPLPAGDFRRWLARHGTGTPNPSVAEPVVTTLSSSILN